MLLYSFRAFRKDKIAPTLSDPSFASSMEDEAALQGWARYTLETKYLGLSADKTDYIFDCEIHGEYQLDVLSSAPVRLAYVHNSDRHIPPRRSTICFETFDSKNYLDSLVSSLATLGQSKFALNLGFSRVHPQDQYNKKIGRAIAENKMNFVEFALTGLLARDEHTDHILYSEASALRLVVRVYKDSLNCRVIRLGF